MFSTLMGRSHRKSKEYDSLVLLNANGDRDIPGGFSYYLRGYEANAPRE